jgi:hypothetical protein
VSADFQKHIKYRKELALQFFELCQQGKFLVQIAEIMGVDKQLLKDWSKDPRKFEFRNAWIRGQQALEVFHVNLLHEMIQSGKKYDSKSKDLQWQLMEKMFEDWRGRPQESKVTIETKELPPEQANLQILNILNKATVARELNIIDQDDSNTDPVKLN